MEKRNPNTECLTCKKAIYRRPSEIAKGRVFCGSKCYGVSNEKTHPCPICGNKVLAGKNKVTCSSECSSINRSRKNIERSGMKYTGKFRNPTWHRLNILKTNFSFNHCMVEGCNYNRTYDVHRLIPGKDGGEYVIGNMFAICPMHHAEVTRNLITLEKINDYTLRITESNPD